MFFNQRFIGTDRDAPITLASPSVIYPVDRSSFKKDKNEKLFIKKFSNEHRKKFQKLFGTKRPSAGVVKRYFENSSSQLS